ncbi:MAG TPA: dTMP kinase [Patescibacteria group bacterium]|nr:dTMP kinase [Patescibacteria group bacterium]
MKYHINLDIELKRNPYKGLYIALEGVDGSGKTTQSEELQKFLSQKGRSFVVTSEPRREGPIGSLIHQILQGKVRVPSDSLQYLYTAERLINHHDVIIPTLEKGDIVISHRCLWSNLPYGMLDRKMADYDSNEARVIDVAHGLLSLYHQFIVPDLTFYLKVSPEVAMERLQNTRGVKEMYEKKEKIARVVKGYDWEVKRFPEEFISIDAEKSIAEVAANIVKKVEEKL